MFFVWSVRFKFFELIGFFYFFLVFILGRKIDWMIVKIKKSGEVISF